MRYCKWIFLLLILLVVSVYSSCVKEQIIYDAAPSADLRLPLLLNFNHTPCFLDKNTQTLKYSIDDTTRSLEVLVAFQAHSRVKLNGVYLVNNAINNLGKVTYHTTYQLEFYFENKVDTFQLQFTPLPLVQLILHDHIQDEPKVLSRMIVNDPSSWQEQIDQPIGIEVRGGFSLLKPKKSYGFKPLSSLEMAKETFSSFLGMKSNNRWILDAMYVDKSRVRNKTSFDIWRSLNITTNKHRAIKGELVELFINHESRGIYCLSEKFTPTQLQTTTSSVLYKGMRNMATTQFRAVPHAPANKSYWGDWLQEIPDSGVEVKWDALEQLLHLTVHAQDMVFIDKIDQHLDLDIAIDYYLFINLINGYDNMGENWFFYQENKLGKLLIIPWDMDATWGRSHESEAIPPTWIITNALFERLIELNPKGFKQKLKQRWSYLRSNIFALSRLNSFFDKNLNALQFSNVTEVENRRWNSGLNLSEERIYINQWIQDRLLFLDSHIVNL